MPMCEQDKTDKPESHAEAIERIRREHRERLAITRETKFEVEPHPGLQRLAESQAEFQEQMKKRLRRLIYGY
jgi:hypothetical protein